MSQTLMRAIATALRTHGHLRVVAYVRVSTEQQIRGYGLSYTLNKIKRHIEAKGDRVLVGTYSDEGVSGSLEAAQREDLTRLMRDARSTPRPFDMVTVYEARGAGRGGRALWPWIWELEDLGIATAVAIDDLDNTTDEGKSRMSKAASEAEAERILIRGRTQGGLQEKAEIGPAGTYLGGRVPYGWRIADQGKTGLSRLVVDECSEGEGPCPKCEAGGARMGRRLFVEHLNWSHSARLATAAGYRKRNGRPWDGPGLERCVRRAIRARRLFRDPGHGLTILNVDGTPFYGNTVEIDLPPIFTEEEAEEFERAEGRRPARAPHTGWNEYPLSGHIVSACGLRYIGFKSHASSPRIYQCQGVQPSHIQANGGRCSCPRLDARATEANAWLRVSRFLGDKGRLGQIAEDWLKTKKTMNIDYVARVADLDQQLAEVADAIAVTTVTTVRQALRSGLNRTEAEDRALRAVRPLGEEEEALSKQREEVLSWQREAAEINSRAESLRSLADRAQVQLERLPVARQSEIYDLLQIEGAIAGPVPKGVPGPPCPITSWFREHGRTVPDLTDEGWADVAQFAGPRRRRFLEGIFHKARTGCPWSAIPKEYGAVRHPWLEWSRSGVMVQILDALAGRPSTPPFEADLTPPLLLRGKLIPELLLQDRDSTGPSRSR
ncbi:recombinase family protein [Streptomyces sp. NPDC051018]|uniref:recombinase family protein n=1 Tax=Streptomyces sp. NPDC051018 TaxID=3365639 RepID=UPI0037A37676